MGRYTIIYCPVCGSDDTDCEQGYIDCWSYGYGTRSEGHYTEGTGAYSGGCNMCESEFGVWGEDLCENEVYEYGPCVEDGDVDWKKLAFATEARLKKEVKRNRDGWAKSNGRIRVLEKFLKGHGLEVPHAE